jgi:hypothetical protein
VEINVQFLSNMMARFHKIIRKVQIIRTKTSPHKHYKNLNIFYFILFYFKKINTTET